MSFSSSPSLSPFSLSLFIFLSPTLSLYLADYRNFRGNPMMMKPTPRCDTPGCYLSGIVSETDRGHFLKHGALARSETMNPRDYTALSRCTVLIRISKSSTNTSPAFTDTMYRELSMHIEKMVLNFGIRYFCAVFY